MKISRKRWKWGSFGIFLVIGFALTAWAVVSLFMWAGCDKPEPSKNAPTETVRRPVTFGSPTEYDGPGGVYRWRVKTDPGMPNDNASEHYKVKLIDIINWPEPSTIIHTGSDRWGIENDFYTVDAELMDLKVEPDGELYLGIIEEPAFSSNHYRTVELCSKECLKKSHQPVLPCGIKGGRS